MNEPATVDCPMHSGLVSDIKHLEERSEKMEENIDKMVSTQYKILVTALVACVGVIANLLTTLVSKL